MIQICAVVKHRLRTPLLAKEEVTRGRQGIRERQQQQTRDVCSSLSLDLRAKVTQLMALAQKHDGLKIALLTVWGGQRAKPCTIVV